MICFKKRGILKIPFPNTMEYIYSYLLVCLTCVGSVNLLKLNESQINQWSVDFKTGLDSHIDNVLGYSKVQSMLTKYENDLLFVPINGSETFAKIYQNVNLKYNDLVLAVNKLKSGLETILSNQQSDQPHLLNRRSRNVAVEDTRDGNGDDAPPGSGPPTVGPAGPPTVPPTGPAGPPTVAPTGPAPPVLPSGGGGGPPPLLPSGSGSVEPLPRCCVPDKSRKYDGRFREEVTLKECYENVDETLHNISNSGIEDIFKKNLVNSSITWQYFADRAGHYVQYPSNERMCDGGHSPNTTSPLLAEWFVEKLHQERKNVVIVVDNGPRTISQTRLQLRSDRQLIVDAVKQALKTLTPRDKVTIVTLSASGAGDRTPPGCGSNLFVASQGNIDKLTDFATHLPLGTGEPNLQEGLGRVYDIYKAEKAEFPSRSNMTNLVLLLVSNQSSVAVGTEGRDLLKMVATQQQLLEHRIQHFVYIVGESADPALTGVLAQLADQNNDKLNDSSGITAKPWPEILNLVESGKPVGREGILEIVKDRGQFPVTVATYFKRLPRQIDSRPTTTIVPVLDKTSGVSLSVAAAVFSAGDKHEAVGVTAVDASLAELFSDITSVDVGNKSYAYLVDVTHGHVLLHPKLREGSDGRHDDAVFPRLRLLEPDLSGDQVQAILQATESVMTFNASMSRGRTAVTGELVTTTTTGSGGGREPVTLHYQLVYGTSLCVVFAHFKSDLEEARLRRPVQQQGLSRLHAPYHRIDVLVPAPVSNKPNKTSVCHLYDNFLSYKESVIKLSPWVFTDPVLYKYSPEPYSQIRELNTFLINDGPTNLIREDVRTLIQHFVRSTDELDALWKDRRTEVTERFLGSSSGVFRLYPGSPLDNTFDHMQTEWYKRSVAFPTTTMYHYGRLSFINHRNVVIVTRALMDKGRMQGVVGMTTTRRLLTSQLISAVADCHGNDKQCHVVDSSGNLLDSFVGDDTRHLSEMYPWLTAALVRKGAMVMDWCTGFSDGYHKQTFRLTQSVTSDLGAADPCRHFSLASVNGTNLFILVLGNRTQQRCDDAKYEICHSCETPAPASPYGLPLPRCQLCLSNHTTQCQCPCYCDTDLDPCQGQFKVNTTDFPMDACFYPVQPNTRLELRPDSPGPDLSLDFCPIPCVAIEDLNICSQLGHCKLDTRSLYPTCIWKEGAELQNSNISRFFPTSPAPPPVTPPTLSTRQSGKPGSSSTSAGLIPPIATTTGSITSTDRNPPVAMTTSTPSPSLLSQGSTQGSSTRVGTTKMSSKSTHKSTQLPTKATSSISRQTSSITKPTTGSPTNPRSTGSSTTQTGSKPTAGSPTTPRSTGSPSAQTGSKTTAGSPTTPRSTGSPTTKTGSTTTQTGSKPTAGSPTTPRSTGSPTTKTGSTTAQNSLSTSPTAKALQSVEPDDGGMSGGAIAGLVIGLLALVVILALVGAKLYSQKFRRPGADTASKYRARSGLFDSAIFHRGSDTVTTGTSLSTNVPYEEIHQP